MEYFLRINNITKQFEGHKALSDISLSVPLGSIFGLLGPNGAGKTTLIRIINRIFEPDSGEVIINGEALKASHVSNIGYLPEERGLYKKMKVGEQIIFFAKLKGLSRSAATRQARFWTDRLNISSWWDKKVEELSKGMQQKIQFIITVLHKPSLLIFDEPFSGFDPINVDLIKKQIIWLRDNGTTIIFSTHNMASVEEICENIVLINNGQKLLDGNIDDIKNKFSQNEYEISFQNIIDAPVNTSDFEFSKIDDRPNSYTVKINDRVPNELLKIAAQYGNIASFNKKVPSLHDIFIKVVSNSTKKNITDE